MLGMRGFERALTDNGLELDERSATPSTRSRWNGSLPAPEIALLAHDGTNGVLPLQCGAAACRSAIQDRSYSLRRALESSGRS